MLAEFIFINRIYKFIGSEFLIHIMWQGLCYNLLVLTPFYIGGTYVCNIR